MTTFYEVTFSLYEPVYSVATVEAESPDEVVAKVRAHYSHVEHIAIHEVTPLETPPEEVHTPPRGKPTLRIVN